MKKLLVICALVLGSSHAVFADLIGSVAVDAFVAGSFDAELEHDDGKRELETDGNLTGGSANVELPFLLGLGVSQIQQKFKDKNVSGVETKYEATMFDVFYSLDVFVKLSLGVGVGEAKVTRSISSVSKEEKKNTGRVFANLGLPIFPLVQFRVGVHQLLESKVEIGSDKVSVGGSLVSVGLGIVF